MNKLPAVAAHMGTAEETDEPDPDCLFGFCINFVLDQNLNGWRSLEAITVAVSRARAKATAKDPNSKVTVTTHAPGDEPETMVFLLEGSGAADPNDVAEELHDWENEFPVAMTESDHLRCLADVVFRCSLNSDLLPFHIESLHSDPGQAVPPVVQNVVEEIRRQDGMMEPNEVVAFLRRNM